MEPFTFKPKPSMVGFRQPAAGLLSLGLLGLAILPACNKANREPELKPTTPPAADAQAEPTSKPAGSFSATAPPSSQPETEPRLATPGVSGISLSDVTQPSGIDFTHHYDGQGQRYILETMASGVASLDFDNDNRQDIYFLNGTTLPEPAASDNPNHLYQNLGRLEFRAVAAGSATGSLKHSLGVCVGDYDNDGFQDIFVNNFGKNALHHNLGDGTFEEVALTAGLAQASQFGAGACFLDANNDGLLDLYVGNYVKDPVLANKLRTTDGYPSYPGPLDFEADTDSFFLNDGDGHFTDHSHASGIASLATTSMGIIATDFDSDGDIDVMVANDVQRNLLLANDGLGNFQEVGILHGVAYSFDAKRTGNMGIDAGDSNNNGSLDLYTTTYSNEMPVLYENDGYGMYSDITLSARAGATLLPHANWGAAFVDLDNDSHLDIFVGNGHTNPNVNKWAYNTSWKVANTVYRNIGGGTFEDISAACGSGLAPVQSSRGIACEDFDSDGDLDVVVLNALAKATLIENVTPNLGNWLQIRLIGTLSNRDAAGAKVRISDLNFQHLKEVHCGRGYQSSYGQCLHFGIGARTSIRQITVTWPSGDTSQLRGIPANSRLVIVQPTLAP